MVGGLLSWAGLVLSGPAHSGHTVHELGPEEDVGVVEHAVLEGHHDELGVLEVGLQHVPDVLGVAQVKGSVHLNKMGSNKA